MLKLYGGARSRASIVQWYLEELAVPYEFVLLDMQAGEHHQPAFLTINPIGKVPAIVEGDFKLWESGAILLYLAEKYGEPNLTLKRRSLLNQWINYANATLSPAMISDAVRKTELPRHMTMLNHLLANQLFIIDESFSVADVALGSLITYCQMMFQIDLSEYSAIVGYVKRLSERPPCQKTILGIK
ncbi:glutathione S-transferase family protein [Phormidium sp. CLA17]|uniref:glutathione S-transferase family protein n=1 Tax=Leptolyngbya sp. Cla-17 TaxID=2803751 RepID=UPI001490D79D|nr:glutathione S-transferase family protein [Leptolyngbya sp. Cla-17]MBM0741453.1 glutathione S-transferase family protein [Leptolyngbya sp. Cla-17]